MCKQFSDAHTSTFAQATAAQYLKAGRMPATLANVRKVYAERAQAMGDALRKDWATPSSSCSPRAACLCGRALRVRAARCGRQRAGQARD
jgi:Transcriptional regulators containing a DNA-binding HTH domain and an aminotransferase domain (MocR family) and their eukaryotic orthologs